MAFYILYFIFNGNKSTTLKSLTPSLQKHLIDLSKLQQTTKLDFQQSFNTNQTDFSTFSISSKHILSTNRLTVSLSENSAQTFYLNQPKPSKPAPIKPQLNEQSPFTLPNDNCFEDAKNCQYFQFLNSKKKKLYTNCNDSIEANFWHSNQINLFLTGTYKTSKENHYAFTRNWNPQDPCWDIHPTWMKEWAQSQDPRAEPMKILIPPTQADPTQFSTIKKDFQQFIKDVHRKYKPSNWKWVVVFELQKENHEFEQENKELLQELEKKRKLEAHFKSQIKDLYFLFDDKVKSWEMVEYVKLYNLLKEVAEREKERKRLSEILG